MRQGRGIDVKALLDSIENEETAVAEDGDAGKSNRATGLFDAQSNFGKTVFQKLCKLRANNEKRIQFRRSVLGRDADYVGHIPKRELQRALDGYCEFTEAELSLLAENLSTVDVKSSTARMDLDYSLLLLLLMDPLERSP